MAITAAEVLLILKARDEASKAFKDMERNGTSSLGAIGKIAAGTAAGMAAFHVATNVAAGGYKLFIGTAANFEQSLNAVSAATGATAEEMKGMRTEALAIGRDTSKSASEAVLAMGELAKAGMPVEQILAGAGRAAVQMAEATGISVPAAAILMSNAMNTFNKDGLSATQTAEIFSRAAGASAIDVTDLGQSLSAVGPVASAAGLSMQDFATSMAVMGQNALKGSDAGTSLKAFLAGLTPVSDKAANAMKAMGFNAFNADGTFKEMRQIVEELTKSMSGMTEQQKAVTGELLFGSDGVRAMNILTKEGAGGWDKMTEAQAKALSIAEQSRRRMEGLNGSIEILKGSVETVSIIFGTLFLGVLADGVGQVTDFVNALVPMVTAFMDLEPVKAILSDVKGAFDSLTASKDAAAALAGVIGGALVVAFYSLATAIGAAVISMAVVAAPFIAIGLVFAGLGIVISRLGVDFGDLARLFKLGVSGGEIGGEFSLIERAAFGLGVVIKETIVPAFKDAKEAFRLFVLILQGGEVGGEFSALQQKAIELGRDMRKMWLEDVKPALSELASVVKAVVGFVISNIGLLSPVIEYAFNFMKTKIEGAIQFWMGFVGLVANVIQLVSALFHGEWALAWEEMKQIASNLIDMFVGYMKYWFGSLPEIVLGVAENLWTAIKKLLGGVVQSAMDYAPQWAQIGLDIVAGIWEGIKSRAGDFLEDVKGFFDSILEVSRTSIQARSPSELFAEVGRDVMLGLIKGFGDKDLAGTAAQAMRDRIAAVYDGAKVGVDTGSIETAKLITAGWNKHVAPELIASNLSVRAFLTELQYFREQGTEPAFQAATIASLRAQEAAIGLRGLVDMVIETNAKIQSDALRTSTSMADSATSITKHAWSQATDSANQAKTMAVSAAQEASAVAIDAWAQVDAMRARQDAINQQHQRQTPVSTGPMSPDGKLIDAAYLPGASAAVSSASSASAAARALVSRTSVLRFRRPPPSLFTWPTVTATDPNAYRAPSASDPDGSAGDYVTGDPLPPGATAPPAGSPPGWFVDIMGNLLGPRANRSGPPAPGSGRHVYIGDDGSWVHERNYPPGYIEERGYITRTFHSGGFVPREMTARLSGGEQVLTPQQGAAYRRGGQTPLIINIDLSNSTILDSMQLDQRIAQGLRRAIDEGALRGSLD